VVLTMLSLLGILWAWRRHVNWLGLDEAERNKATRTEHIVLWLLSIACLVSIILLGLDPAAGLSSMGARVLLAFSIAVWVGTLYKLYRDTISRRWSDAPPLATEGVMLWSGACVLLVAMGLQPGGGQLDDRVVWVHVFKEKGGGLIVSSPEVVGNNIFVSVAHKQGFETFGVVYCLDLETRKTLWAFDDDGNMKQIYSSPRVSDGLLYIGEGFHDDPNCKLYCIDVSTGKKVWDYQTTSQTESSPCVADGKVFIGAGNEGVLALDAKSGKLLWQYPPPPSESRWRVAANPVVVDGRLYVGSGIDRNHPEDPGETSLVCLDSQSGKSHWKVATPLPCWAGVAVVDDRVFLALGNGDVFFDAASPATPAGALWSIDAESGKVLWKQDFPNGILGQPAVDQKHVYCGSRDGHAFASAGRVACLDTETGESHWTYRALEQPGILITSTPVLLRKDDEGITKRRLVFGAALNDLSIPVLYCLEDLVLSSTAMADGR
jgi:outer membrane protein assembly factor BamB